MITSLVERLDTHPNAPNETRDDLLDIFLDWAEDLGIELYEAQEEAIIELFGDNNVVLNTPTGSGKSLVAVAFHFLGLATRRRSAYTSPIKALVSEKFFDLCRTFGAENVGMITGDASINSDAPIICCTAEILSNMALKLGNETDFDFIVMDEFHYYGDRDRGVAWQIPLIVLERVRYLLMSATLGEMQSIVDDIERRTEAPVRWVRSTQRPVPLEFHYSEITFQEAVERLVSKNHAPVYVVRFTQRECAEQAQALTSVNFCSKEEKAVIAKELKGFRFDSPYGKEMRRFVKHGIGLHHAGLLPRYRLLVEKLAQQGLLKVIVGTDTLGVGINVPIRTVLFGMLCKYDGEKVRVLSVREFKQIAGRAGRKGFDDLGYVVAQAPEHIIENARLEAKSTSKGKKKFVKRKPPTRGYVKWDEETFRKLASGRSENLTSQFQIDHGMILQLLQRDTLDTPAGDGYRALVDLIAAAHVTPGYRSILRRRARTLFRSLVDAAVVATEPRGGGEKGSRLVIDDELPNAFSLFYTLSLFALDTIEQLDPEVPNHELHVLTIIESILEHPRAVLYAQVNTAKGELLAKLKAEGVEYDERMEKLRSVEYPKPDADALYAVYNAFRLRYPWAAEENVRPKSVARDMYERYMSFNEYIKHYGLERSEGVLLRYLTQVFKVLVQTVPEVLMTDELVDLVAYFRATIERIDSSLVHEWEEIRAGGDAEESEAPKAADISRDPRAFAARIRAELHGLVAALAKRDLEEAELCVRALEDDDVWDTARFAQALEPYYEEHAHIVFNHEARLPPLTHVVKNARHQWTVRQVLVDPERNNDWYIEGRIDLRLDASPAGPMIELVQISNRG